MVLFAAITVMQIAALQPVDRNSEAWWAERHAACVETTKKGGFDVAFLGDSITQGWEGAGKRAWDASFAPLKSANFGFSGDRTEHVLWRLAHGELIAAKPKVVVLMIGTNNLGHGSSNPAQTAQGVRAVCDAIVTGSPGTRVLLLGILPRGEGADDQLRVAVGQATASFRSRADGREVFFADTGYPFVRPDGKLKALLMPDLLHLSEGGYEVWAKAILPQLQSVLRKN